MLFGALAAPACCRSRQAFEVRSTRLVGNAASLRHSRPVRGRRRIRRRTGGRCAATKPRRRTAHSGLICCNAAAFRSRTCAHSHRVEAPHLRSAYERLYLDRLAPIAKASPNGSLIADCAPACSSAWPRDTIRVAELKISPRDSSACVRSARQRQSDPRDRRIHASRSCRSHTLPGPIGRWILRPMGARLGPHDAQWSL